MARIKTIALSAHQPRMPWRMDVQRDPRTQLIVSAQIVPIAEEVPA